MSLAGVDRSFFNESNVNASLSFAGDVQDIFPQTKRARAPVFREEQQHEVFICVRFASWEIHVLISPRNASRDVAPVKSNNPNFLSIFCQNLTGVDRKEILQTLTRREYLNVQNQLNGHSIKDYLVCISMSRICPGRHIRGVEVGELSQPSLFTEKVFWGPKMFYR